MNEEEKKAIKYFKELRYGEVDDNYKDILLNLIEKQNKIINLMAKERAEISDEIPVPAEAIINYYLKMVEEENETN